MLAMLDSYAGFAMLSMLCYLCILCYLSYAIQVMLSKLCHAIYAVLCYLCYLCDLCDLCYLSAMLTMLSMLAMLDTPTVYARYPHCLCGIPTLSMLTLNAGSCMYTHTVYVIAYPMGPNGCQNASKDPAERQQSSMWNSLTQYTMQCDYDTHTLNVLSGVK